jgi:hypothetical protein
METTDISRGEDQVSIRVRRYRKALLRSALMVLATLTVLALLGLWSWDAPEVRLKQVVCIQKELQGTWAAKYTKSTGEEDDLPATHLAEFEIRVLSEQKLWITEEAIGVEVFRRRSGWSRLVSEGEPPPGNPWLRPGRVLTRTIWVPLPAETTSCRLTIGFRHQMPREDGLKVLDQSGVASHFPGVIPWLTKHLPTRQRWMVCRREVEVPTRPLKLAPAAVP